MCEFLFVFFVFEDFVVVVILICLPVEIYHRTIKMGTSVREDLYEVHP